ncbi:MAG TPA: 3-phosphoshikimate 1-carboxyvinyltransferase [Candidatus Hydrogenedentes bacterium]|nr:3-phosphoshikimate 1-carboxyvinyltransferase [Candidatus Hydrogenedentota bacterium]
MKVKIYPSRLSGTVRIPGSKSHTIRAVTIASLADGNSEIHHPLVSLDALSARETYRAFGAEIDADDSCWRIRGFGGIPRVPDNCIDVGNSGTTMNMALGTASLLRQGMAVLTGDEQVRRRPNGPLAEALNALGAEVVSTRGTGTPPFAVRGRLRGGHTTIEVKNSQYVSSLLIHAPLADQPTTLHVPVLFEKPYVAMTLDWLRRQGIQLEHDDALEHFRIPGGQRYQPVNRAIPGDFSTATFFLAAGALPGNRMRCLGLNMNDTQGDKAVVDYLRAMGADITVESDAVITGGVRLEGHEFDLNATPDALPMMAALACHASGETRLVNVAQARLKETDRIQVMREELSRLGADISEREDGLIIRESALRGGTVFSHGDHRVAMALAVAATAAEGPVTIDGMEAVSVTYPEFIDHLTAAGGQVEILEP